MRLPRFVYLADILAHMKLESHIGKTTPLHLQAESHALRGLTSYGPLMPSILFHNVYFLVSVVIENIYLFVRVCKFGVKHRMQKELIQK